MPKTRRKQPETRAYYVRLAGDLADLLQRDADRLRLPLSTMIRLKLGELYADELAARDSAQDEQKGAPRGS